MKTWTKIDESLFNASKDCEGDVESETVSSALAMLGRAMGCDSLELDAIGAHIEETDPVLHGRLTGALEELVEAYRATSAARAALLGFVAGATIRALGPKLRKPDGHIDAIVAAANTERAA